MVCFDCLVVDAMKSGRFGSMRSIALESSLVRDSSTTSWFMLFRRLYLTTMFVQMSTASDSGEDTRVLNPTALKLQHYLCVNVASNRSVLPFLREFLPWHQKSHIRQNPANALIVSLG